MTRSPGARNNFDEAATDAVTPAAINARYNPEPRRTRLIHRRHRPREIARHVGWIPVLTDPTIEALRHSIGSVACIARELGMHVDTATIWCAACADAQAAHFVVGDGSKVWKPKPFLRRWAELTPVRVGA